MKVKCIKLLNEKGEMVDFSPWLTLGRVYHVMSWTSLKDGSDGFYGIVTSHPEGEWPQLTSHSEKCFEVVSNKIPTNWKKWDRETATGFSPSSWQEPGFYEAFYDRDPAAYPAFEKEQAIILKEDP